MKESFFVMSSVASCMLYVIASEICLQNQKYIIKPCRIDTSVDEPAQKTATYVTVRKVA